MPKRCADREPSHAILSARFGRTSQNDADSPPMSMPPEGRSGLPPPAAPNDLVAEGLIHHKSGKTAAASACYDRALKIDPAHGEANRLLGVALAQQNRFTEALPFFERAVGTRPDDPTVLSNLAATLRELRRFDDARRRAERAVALAPSFPDARQNLGAILHDLGRLEDARSQLETALALHPDQLGALISLGAVLRDQGKIDQAVSTLRRALALAPRHGEAHWTLATTLLVAGRLPEGWRAFEWRWQRPGLVPRRFREPRWTGEPLNNRTILLHAEQGRGDSIQFIRYAPMVRERGVRVIVQAQPELTRLLRMAPGVDQVIANTEPLPPFDLQSPLMSLPGVFATRLDTIPADSPYLRAEAQAVTAWQHRLSALPRPRIGLVWAGTATHRNDHNRSVPLDRLRPLVDDLNAGWVSLQMGDRRQDLLRSAFGKRVPDLSPHLSDFADTAAALVALDLLITVDTAVAHLAGALGRPAWVLLPYAPDWRWLRDRTDTPWYPSLRLFRQSAPGDWAGVIEAVRHALNSPPACSPS